MITKKALVKKLKKLHPDSRIDIDHSVYIDNYNSSEILISFRCYISNYEFDDGTAFTEYYDTYIELVNFLINHFKL